MYFLLVTPYLLGLVYQLVSLLSSSRAADICITLSVAYSTCDLLHLHLCSGNMKWNRTEQLTSTVILMDGGFE